MIKETYVSLEVAKLLQEKGFNVPVWTRYENNDDDDDNEIIFGGKYNWNNSHIGQISAPTQQMAMAWLREHGLHINASISYFSVDADGNEVDRWTFWLFEILSSFSGNLIYTEEVNQYDSYEEAIEAAIKYCLENLI